MCDVPFVTHHVLNQVVPVMSKRSGAAGSTAAGRGGGGMMMRQFYPQGPVSGRGLIRGLALLQNGLHIATVGLDRVVKLFNRFTLTLENAVPVTHDFDVNAMAFNQNGELLVTCRFVMMLMLIILLLRFVILLPMTVTCSYSDWKLWDTRDRRLIESFEGHRSDVTGVAINSRGTGVTFVT